MKFKKSMRDKSSCCNTAPLLNTAVETIPFTFFFATRKSTVAKHAHTHNSVVYVIDGLSVINLHSEGTAGARITGQDPLLLSAPFTV